ncbi:hypothetical protein TSST111916_09295 [Tsukamurella strandjordii]|uniref:hypothetical protein n=1 Tax=Tsukamurella TaxID=2060 RepID=UPI001C7DAE94|nr:hypothetical protein [Tsukamurella sp. TY48]
MFRPAHPAATARGVFVGGTSFAASLTAHIVAMAGSMPAPAPAGHPMADGTMAGGAMSAHSMPGHAMPTAMPGHVMPTAMPGHDMAAMGTDAGMPMGPAIPLTSVLLLAGVCAIIGALAARPRAAGPVAAGAMVLFGQLGGHLALGLTMGHLALTPSMGLAHLAAAVVAGLAIAGAERALRLAVATLRPVRAAWLSVRRTVVHRVWEFRTRPLSVLSCHGALRAPPA